MYREEHREKGLIWKKRGKSKGILVFDWLLEEARRSKKIFKRSIQEFGPVVTEVAEESLGLRFKISEKTKIKILTDNFFSSTYILVAELRT